MVIPTEIFIRTNFTRCPSITKPTASHGLAHAHAQQEEPAKPKKSCLPPSPRRPLSASTSLDRWGRPERIEASSHRTGGCDCHNEKKSCCTWCDPSPPRRPLRHSFGPSASASTAPRCPQRSLSFYGNLQYGAKTA
jgi:hypothetical protein